MFGFFADDNSTTILFRLGMSNPNAKDLSRCFNDSFCLCGLMSEATNQNATFLHFKLGFQKHQMQSDVLSFSDTHSPFSPIELGTSDSEYHIALFALCFSDTAYI